MNLVNSLYFRISLKVPDNRLRLALTGLNPISVARIRRGGSCTFFHKGIVKTNHHTETVKNDILVMISVKWSGESMIIARLIANNIPPPAYPIA